MEYKVNDFEALRMRPKNDYLHTASWEQLYILTEHWESDLQFFIDESKFLTKLISQYFIWITKDESLDKVQDMVKELDRLKEGEKELGNKIKKHLDHLELLMENAFTQEESIFRNEHAQLEDRFAEFAKEYRKVKQKIFTVTEHVIESERFQHLLTA